MFGSEIFSWANEPFGFGGGEHINLHPYHPMQLKNQRLL